MKLLTVCVTLDAVSGAGVAVRTVRLNRALADRGVDCTILTGHDGATRSGPADLRGIDVISLPVVAGRFRVPVGRFGALDEAVRVSDLILLMNHWTALNALGYRAARRESKPYIVCPCGALPVFGRSRLLKRAYNAVIGHRIMSGASGHIAITRDEIEHFTRYGVDRTTIAVIPNGIGTEAVLVDPAGFRQRIGLGDAPFLLFLGRLAPIKGPDLLLSAFIRCAVRFPAWHLVMAGSDGGMLALLRRMATRAGLGHRVHFVGFLDEDRKQEALAAGDLVVIPSRSEAMSIVVLEAAAAGRPVLMTDRCGLPEVAEVGGGWVVPATVAGLECGLNESLVDPARRRDRGDAWRRFALDRFAWSRIASLSMGLFSRVLAEQNGK